MIRKLIIVSALLVISTSIAACSNPLHSVVSNQTTSTIRNKPRSVIGDPVAQQSMKPQYEIVKMTYSFKDISIDYPQIRGFSDTAKQYKINRIIKNKAINNYINESNASAEIGYDIKYINNDLISIAYEGLSFYKGAAHPNKLFWTTNIDLNRVKTFKLKDMVKINGNLCDRYKKGNCQWGFLGRAIIYSSYNNKELLEAFDSADSYYDNYSYLTPNALGISVSVCFADGGHQEVEIPYQQLANNIKFNNDLWRFLPNVKPLNSKQYHNKLQVDKVKKIIGNYSLVELTTDEILNKMNAQIFAYNSNSRGYTYYIKNGKAILLCSVTGDNWGIQDTYVTDLDHDGDPELIYDCDYSDYKNNKPYRYAIYGLCDGARRPVQIMSAPDNITYLLKEIDNRIFVISFNFQDVDLKPSTVGEIKITHGFLRKPKFRLVKSDLNS